MSDLTREQLLSRLEEAESVIRKLLLATTYDDFARCARSAENTACTLREILSSQNRQVCERLEAMGSAK